MLGNRLKKLREDKGLKQDELAKELSVSPSAIGMYERDSREPNNELIIKIANFFNVSTDYLMGISEYKNEQDYVEKNHDFIGENLSFYPKLLDQYPNFKAEDIASAMIHFHHLKQDATEYMEEKLAFLPLEVRNKARNIVLIFYNFALYSSNNSIIERNLLPENSRLFNIPILGKITAGQPILADEYLEGYLPVDPNIYGMTTPDDYFYLRVSGESMNLKVHNGDYALIHKQDTAEDGDIVVAIVNGDDEATLKKYKRISEETVALEPMSTLPMEPIYVNLKETNFKIIGKAIGQFGKF